MMGLILLTPPLCGPPTLPLQLPTVLVVRDTGIDAENLFSIQKNSVDLTVVGKPFSSINQETFGHR
jgi:hypothetical protein